MTTSGSYDFSLTAAQLSSRVAKNLGILESGGTINSNDQTDILETLNVVVKELQGTSDGATGLKLHTRKRITLMLAKGQREYLIGPATTDSRASELVGRTTLNAAAIANATTLSVTSLTDTTTYPGTTITMTASDFIGIQLNDGTIHWTTIVNAATPTITTGLASAAASGNYVWWFTSRAQRFPVCEAAVLRTAGGTDTPLYVYENVREYDEGVAVKSADGTPMAVIIEPQRLNTRVILNSEPTDVTSQVVLTVQYPAEDYDATSNDIAFPQEWFGFLEWEVTLRSCPQYGKEFTPTMELNYKTARSRCFTLNPEKSVQYFQCDAPL